MSTAGVHDICKTTPLGIPYRLRHDGSVLIGMPKDLDAPYWTRRLLEVSAEALDATTCRMSDWRGYPVDMGDVVDEIWFIENMQKG